MFVAPAEPFAWGRTVTAAAGSIGLVAAFLWWIALPTFNGTQSLNVSAGAEQDALVEVVLDDRTDIPDVPPAPAAPAPSPVPEDLPDVDETPALTAATIAPAAALVDTVDAPVPAPRSTTEPSPVPRPPSSRFMTLDQTKIRASEAPKPKTGTGTTLTDITHGVGKVSYGGLSWRKRVAAVYPHPDKRSPVCVVKLRVAPDGRPARMLFERCPGPFQRALRTALFKSRLRIPAGGANGFWTEFTVGFDPRPEVEPTFFRGE